MVIAPVHSDGRFALFQRPHHSCGNVIGSVTDVGQLSTDRLRVIGAQKIGRCIKGISAHIHTELFAKDIGNALRLETGVFLGVFLAGRTPPAPVLWTDRRTGRLPKAHGGRKRRSAHGRTRQPCRSAARPRTAPTQGAVDQGVQQCPCVMGNRLRRSRSGGGLRDVIDPLDVVGHADAAVVTGVLAVRLRRS